MRSVKVIGHLVEPPINQLVDSASTAKAIGWIGVMMRNSLWTFGLHAMFGFLLVFGVLRAWADDRLDARVFGLAIALAVVYAGFVLYAARKPAKPVPTTLWLAALCLLWIGLMVHAQDFMWMEFPLVFVLSLIHI